jgi:hypothetical protein
MCPRSEWNTFLLPERRTGQSLFIYFIYFISPESGTLAGADPGSQVKKKLRRAEGGAKIFGVFRVKNHDFAPKNHIFSNFRAGRAPGALPPWIRPCLVSNSLRDLHLKTQISCP